MKHRKIVVIGCALALSATPFTSTAYTAENALAACAAAVRVNALKSVDFPTFGSPTRSVTAA